MRMRVVAAIAVVSVFFLGLMLGSQAAAAEPQNGSEPMAKPRLRAAQWERERPPYETPLEKEQQRKMEKARNENRQQDLKRDTARLLELATELKEYVDKTNESVLSVEVIRKAEEIERLAKSVRNKMKG